MTAYYNEIDPYAAQWLRNLIAGGHIAPGDVDERSIVDVRPADLAGYDQCHFFAGIGGWSVALRLAGWPDDRSVWTGSCPCQPFSAAGAGKAADDRRHLWPAWMALIRECRPATVFGEQVEAAIGWGWLDLVCADLEQEGYACGASVLPACGVGAPHIRQRLWFVGHAPVYGSGAFVGQSRAGARRQEQAGGSGVHGLLADADPRGPGEHRSGGLFDGERPALGDDADGRSQGLMADANGAGLQERERDGRVQRQTLGPSARQAAVGRGDPGFWSDLEWLPCSDGKARPTIPGLFPLAHGVQRRASKLRAYGNAIVPQVAAEFIKSCSHMTDELPG